MILALFGGSSSVAVAAESYNCSLRSLLNSKGYFYIPRNITLTLHDNKQFARLVEGNGAPIHVSVSKYSLKTKLKYGSQEVIEVIYKDSFKAPNGERISTIHTIAIFPKRNNKIFYKVRLRHGSNKWVEKYGINHSGNGKCEETEIPSAKTPSEQTCSKNSRWCSDTYLCKLAAPDVPNAKKAWFSSSSKYYKYVVEAKKRGLSCGVRSSVSTTFGGVSASDLPDCPSNRNVRWHNCFGTFTLQDGNKYVGEFKDDKRNGQGTDTFGPQSDFAGDKYVGEYKDGKRHGQGTYTWSDGTKYVGEYKDDKRNGQGTGTWSNGNKYVGEHKDGKRNGQGTETWSNGNKYVGEYKDDKRHGQGTFTFASGRVEEGIWKDDEFQYAKTPTTKTAGTCANKASLCNNTFLCKLAAPDVPNGKKEWFSSSSKYYKYVVEAKKRGLSCGVVSSSPTTKVAPPAKTTSDCTVNNLKGCSNNVLCRLAVNNFVAGKKIWGNITHKTFGKFVVEAKKRGLSCGVGSSSSAPAVETKMPRTGIEPAPVVPIKQSETTTKSASSLIDPLHIKKYVNTYHTRLLPNIVFFIGEIKENDERGFRAALRAHKVDTVVLISPGGLINEGLRIANIINDKSLATYVPVAATCASACSFMFFAGNPKLAHGRLGVHQFYIEDDKKKVAIGKVQKGTQRLVAEIIENLGAFGTPASVYSKMFSASGMYFFSEEEKSAFSNNEINPKLISKINEVLMYFLKSLDNDFDDSTLNSMSTNMKNNLTQLELVRIGCMKGPIDGIKGEATSSAIKLLSSKKGSDISARKFSDLFRVLNNTKVGACY